MMPIVDGLEQQYKDQMVVRRINAEVGDGPAIMRAYRIPGHPALLIIDGDGQEIRRLMGPQPVETIEELLQTLLISPPSSESDPNK